MKSKHSRLSKSPIRQFEKWYSEAQASDTRLPDAMTLATSTKRGRPSARVVLYKGTLQGAFRLFTNYESRKAHELVENPFAALVFHWEKLDRQVRIEGKIKPMPRAESLKYFRSRPRGSQIGAWASHQSSEIPDRKILEKRVAELEKKFQGQDVPCPPFWGGFLLIPDRFEFWINQEDRLHDRFLYKKSGRSWKIVRLSP